MVYRTSCLPSFMGWEGVIVAIVDGPGCHKFNLCLLLDELFAFVVGVSSSSSSSSSSRSNIVVVVD